MSRIRGPLNEALGEGDPLAHSARELVRVAILEAGEAYPRDPVACAFARFFGVHAVIAGARGDVLEDALPGEDGVGLEDEADALRDAVEGLAVDEHLPLARRLEAGDETEGRGLAAAGRPDDGAELARRHLEGKVFERRVDGPRRRQKALANAGQSDGPLHCWTLWSGAVEEGSLAVFAAFLVVLVAVCAGAAH